MTKSLPQQAEFPGALEFPSDRVKPEYTDFPTVNRCFAFIDITGYTQFTKINGTHAAAELLLEFRQAVRGVVGRRGIRVAKWLGDGVMLVSERTAPVVAAALELNFLAGRHGYEIHSGISYGPVLIFEGDDFIGETVNIAARLSEHAKAEEILCYKINVDDNPAWVKATKVVTDIFVKGVGALDGVYRLDIVAVEE
jgi:adenylate cyclase